MTGKQSCGPFRTTLASAMRLGTALAGALLAAFPALAAVAHPALATLMPPALATDAPGPAQDSTPPPPGQEAVQPPKAEEDTGPPSMAETGTGFTLGRIGGIGLIHRQFLPDGLGWGLGGIAVYTSKWFLNAGVQGYYTLHRSRNERLYVLSGVSYIQDLPSPFGVGLGLGWTLGESKGVAFSFELPCVIQFGGTTESYSIFPIPNVALVFNY